MRICSLMLSCFVVLLLGVPLHAAAPPLEQYEVTKLDMRGDLIRGIQVNPADPAIVYLAGQNGGVYKSTDYGKTWKHVLATNGRGLALDPRHPDTVYVGGFGGIHRTTDGGKTWTQILKATLRSVGVNPVSGVIFGGGNSGVIYRSDDDGQTWTKPERATNGEINKWAFDSKDANIVYHSAAKNRGVFKSTDGGVTWKESLKEYGRAVAISPSNPNILYSSDHKSTDGGKTWKRTGGGRAWAIAIHPQNPDIVYKAAQGDAVFVTLNGGRFWSQVKGLTRGGQTDLTANWSIAIDGKNDIVYVGAAVLYKAEKASTPAATLFESSAGLTSPDVVSIVGTKDVLWNGTDGQGVSRSTDFGRTWERRLLGLRGKLHLGALTIHPLDNNIIYAAGEGGLVKTTNGGQIWLHMPHPPGKVRSVDVDPLNKEGVYTIANQTLYYSSNGGFDWTPWEGKEVTSFVIHPNQPRTMFAAGPQGWQRSDDSGQNWKPINVPSKGGLIISRNPQTPATYYSLVNRRELWKSADAGAHWEKIREPNQFRNLSEASDGTLWVTDRSQVHLSRDGGKTWESRGGIGGEIRRILADPNNPQAAYVAVNGGLFWLHPAGTMLPPAPPKPAPTPEPKQATLQISKSGILDRPNTVYQLSADITARGTAFFVIADNITIDGQGHQVNFDISAVEANGVKNLTLKNMQARQAPASAGSSHGDAHAFDLQFCPDAVLTGLNIETIKRGVSAISVDGDRATVTDNVIAKLGIFSTAITVQGEKVRVENNQINASSSGRGIAVAGAKDALISGNTISYGGPTGVSGLTVSVAPGARIEDNIIKGSGQDNAALDVSYSEGATISKNTITSSSPLLRLLDSSQSKVLNNTLEATSGPVLRWQDTDGSTVSGNTITVTEARGPAVIFADSSRNNMRENKWTGVDLTGKDVIGQDAESKENVVE